MEFYLHNSGGWEWPPVEEILPFWQVRTSKRQPERTRKQIKATKKYADNRQKKGKRK